MTTPTTKAASAATFDPARWLTQFEAVGGGYTVTESRLSLAIYLDGQPDEHLSQARQMIVDLTAEQAEIVRAHIEATQALAMLGEA